MKANDCKLIRHDIEETEFGRELSPGVVQHMDQCTSCREFFESDKKIRQMVGSLAPVEAPADFDFRLSARIAQTSTRRFGGWNFSLAVPSAVIAALVLIVVGIFAFRSPQIETRNQTATTTTSDPSKDESKTQAGGTDTHLSKPSNENPNPEKSKVIPEKNRRLVKPNEAVAQRSGLVIEDSSSRGARIVKSEQPLVGIQPQLVFPMQTLTVSVDDAKGVSRTISFPTVSFGSQRVLAGNGASYQTPARTNW
jgi:hypothetical protein